MNAQELQKKVIAHARIWEDVLAHEGWESQLGAMREQYQLLCEQYESIRTKIRSELPQNVDKRILAELESLELTARG